jgi:alkanesulfonate monooxygenase SsuD/methylene tetrahydromethanopterin reductase-like flavin-dependent oxidoreductase (luciferase family)
VQRIWAEAEKELVEDRVLTRFVGTAESVTHQLEALAEVTDADELLITTIAHTHIDRLRSVELLAAHWNGTRLTESDRKIADWVAI